MFTGYDPAAVPKGFVAAKAATQATGVHQETPREDMKRHFTGKRKANTAVEPKAETETPTRRVAPRVSYGQLESDVPAVVAPSPAEVPAVAALSPAPAAATSPALDEPALAAAENQWKEEEEHGHVTSAGAAEVSTLVEVDRLRQRLAAQERRNAEWQRINLDMLALTQRVMAMAAEGDGGGER